MSVPMPSDELRSAAAEVLRANDRGRMTVAAPRLYPHQWSWDAAFVAIGLAHLSVRRACVELEHLLHGQWRNGMIPHIVFGDDDHDYFPGPEWWRCADVNDDAPRSPATSGICQPPAHALAVAQIIELAARTGPDEHDIATSFARAAWPALLAWHRWLFTRRRSSRSGLVMIVHGWESGMDNSPRWDEPYSRVVIDGELPPYRRTDLRIADSSQRPSGREYDRYLWLIEEMRSVGYRDVAVVERASFLAGDVFISAMLAEASDVLADIGDQLSVAAADVDWLRTIAGELRAAVAATVDPGTGLAVDVDERTGERLGADTIAGFSPLLCGGLDESVETRMLEVFHGPDWSGHPGLIAALPPSTTPASPRFESTRYWRGPIWPVMAWLFGWALGRRGFTEEADQMRVEGLRLVSDGNFGEYYEPYTGDWLGSKDQSWTAAVTLDWLSPTRVP